jgi:hypothetical protein
VACGCYPLAPSKYVISNRNAAEGSLAGYAWECPPTDQTPALDGQAVVAANTQQALAADELERSVVTRDALLRAMAEQ